jgi:hypothetical protein
VRKPHHGGQIASAETAPLAVAETAPLSISRVGTPHLGEDDATTSPSTPPDTPPPGLPPKSAIDALTLADALPSNAPTTIAAARPRLAWARPVAREVWSRPVVRELTGAKAISRRDEIGDAEITPQAADLMRPTIH